jgi:hypothetical protein
MPLAQGDERALLFDVVRKALEDLLAADTAEQGVRGCAAAQRMRDRTGAALKRR